MSIKSLYDGAEDTARDSYVSVHLLPEVKAVRVYAGEQVDSTDLNAEEARKVAEALIEGAEKLEEAAEQEAAEAAEKKAGISPEELSNITDLLHQYVYRVEKDVHRDAASNGDQFGDEWEARLKASLALQDYLYSLVVED